MLPLEAADGAVGGEKGILGQVFGFLIVVDEPAADRVDQAGLVPEKPGKRCVVPPAPPPPFPSAHL